MRQAALTFLFCAVLALFSCNAGAAKTTPPVCSATPIEQLILVERAEATAEGRIRLSAAFVTLIDGSAPAQSVASEPAGWLLLSRQAEISVPGEASPEANAPCAPEAFPRLFDALCERSETPPLFWAAVENGVVTKLEYFPLP